MIPVVFTDAVVVNPVAVTLVRFAPEPWKLVDVTEFIPDILDAPSPIIFPFAFKAPNTVREVNDPSEVIFALQFELFLINYQLKIHNML